MIASRPRLGVLLAWVILASPFGVAHGASDWSAHARRFTGESAKVREASIAALRKNPNLVSELRQAFGTGLHFLALDVISALELRSMAPDLLAFAEKDPTGYAYHVLNSLLEPSDFDRVGQVYLDRLDRSTTSPAAKMAMLDASARMEITLGPERSARLLKDDSPEVRSATLALFRTELLRRNYQRGLPVIEVTIRDPAFQMRIQTLFLISELPGHVRRANLSLIAGALASCVNDPVSQVKTLCKSVSERVAR